VRSSTKPPGAPPPPPPIVCALTLIENLMSEVNTPRTLMVEHICTARRQAKPQPPWLAACTAAARSMHSSIHRLVGVEGSASCSVPDLRCGFGGRCGLSCRVMCVGIGVLRSRTPSSCTRNQAHRSWEVLITLLAASRSFRMLPTVTRTPLPSLVPRSRWMLNSAGGSSLTCR